MYEKERFENFFETKHDLDYKPITMYENVRNYANKHGGDIAYEFQGKTTTYSEFMNKVEIVAKSLTAIGIREGEAVTICMPNSPQAIDTFYAINRIGAIANMIHPLSAQSEITYYLTLSKSKVILTLDQFYDKVVAARADCAHQVIILMTHVSTELPIYLKPLYALTSESKYKDLPNKAYSLEWTEFLKLGKNFPLPLPKTEFKIDRTAVILYSGGTTGTSKGIMLTDLNFNALADQLLVAADLIPHPGDSVLAAMPLFHGFGLGVSIHTCLAKGIYCILVPSFTVKSYGKTLLKKKPNVIAGVPTLFEAMLRTEGMDKADLSFLKGVYSGGDSLSIELKTKVDNFLHEHNCQTDIKEGYGTTECVTASCLTPKNNYKPGSIGVGFPDTKYIICTPGTDDEVPTGEEGEICLSGPTVMKGYLDNDEETAATLHKHADGRIYLHTGDLGYMDEEDYVFFKQRIKRMIITSGYNVYPSQVENVIDAHPKVLYSCAIGVKDSYRMQRVKAFVVLKPGVVGDDSIKAEILEYCSKHIAKYAIPREIEFRDELPKTLVGKVAYRILEEEEEAKEAAAAAEAAAKEAAEAEAKANEKAAKSANKAKKEPKQPAEANKEAQQPSEEQLSRPAACDWSLYYSVRKFSDNTLVITML